MFITVRKETLLKLAAAVLFLAVLCFYLFRDSPAPIVVDVPSDQPSESSSLPSPSEGMITVSYDRVSEGPLVVVSKNALLSSVSEEGLVLLCDEKSDTYRLRDNTLRLQGDLMEDLNRFLTDARNEGGISSLVVLSAYRDFDYQRKLYEDELRQKGEEGKNWVSPPGGSEHHTGLCFDLAVASGGKLTKISDHETFSWLHQNCQKYGFVLRYDKGKEEITGYGFEPWHFRYVGLPHASYMAEQGLCLEEYMDLLHQTSESAPLCVTVNNTSYTIYRLVPEPEGSVQVPQNAEISGDNMGGIIVTLAK